MLKIFGVRAAIGQFIIGNAISAFNKTLKSLEAGMAHLRADLKKHQDNVATSAAKIEELNGQINKADTFAANIKKLMGE